MNQESVKPESTPPPEILSYSAVERSDDSRWYTVLFNWYPLAFSCAFPVTFGIAHSVDNGHQDLLILIFIIGVPLMNVFGIVFGALRLPDSKEAFVAGMVSVVANIVALIGFVIYMLNHLPRC